MAQVAVDYRTGPGTAPAPLKPTVFGATTVATQPRQTTSEPSGVSAQQVQQTQTQTKAAQQKTANPYDYSGDPILMQAKAYAAKANEQAQAQADARLKQLGIEYNDPNNPFSTVARLDRRYGEDVYSTNEGFNKANLWYGGQRGKALGQLATALQQSKYDAANQYRAQTTDVANNLAQALLGTQQGLIGAEGDAYGRALQQALAYGIDPGAGQAGPKPGVDFDPAETANLPPGSVAQGIIAPGATAPDLFSRLQNADPEQLAQALQPPAPAQPAAQTPAAKPKPQAPARYYTYRKDVPLKPGQTVRFTAGRGYYAA